MSPFAAWGELVASACGISLADVETASSSAYRVLRRREAKKKSGAVAATWMGGRCVPVMSGTIDLV